MTDPQTLQAVREALETIKLRATTADGWEDGETFYKSALESIRESADDALSLLTTQQAAPSDGIGSPTPYSDGSLSREYEAQVIVRANPVLPETITVNGKEYTHVGKGEYRPQAAPTKDSRENCPWKCRADDGKCMCKVAKREHAKAAQDEVVERLRDLLALTPDSYKELARQYTPGLATVIEQIAALSPQPTRTPVEMGKVLAYLAECPVGQVLVWNGKDLQPFYQSPKQLVEHFAEFMNWKQRISEAGFPDAALTPAEREEAVRVAAHALEPHAFEPVTDEQARSNDYAFTNKRNAKERAMRNGGKVISALEAKGYVGRKG